MNMILNHVPFYNFTTTFSCWNDLLIEMKRLPNDIKIIERFYEWHDKKEDIKRTSTRRLLFQ